MHKKYTNQEILDLAAKYDKNKDLSIISELCDEILRLREEIKDLKEYKWKYEELCK